MLNIGDIIEFNDPQNCVQQILSKRGKAEFKNRLLICDIDYCIVDLIERGFATKNDTFIYGIDTDFAPRYLTVAQFEAGDITVIRSVDIKKVAYDLFFGDQEG